MREERVKHTAAPKNSHSLHAVHETRVLENAVAVGKKATSMTWVGRSVHHPFTPRPGISPTLNTASRSTDAGITAALGGWNHENINPNLCSVVRPDNWQPLLP